MQEGSGFIKDLLTYCCFTFRISNAIKEVTHRKVDNSKVRLPPVPFKMKRKINLVKRARE